MTATTIKFTDADIDVIVKSLSISEDAFAKRLERFKGTDRYDAAYREYVATSETLDKARQAKRLRLAIDAT